MIRIFLEFCTSQNHYIYIKKKYSSGQSTRKPLEPPKDGKIFIKFTDTRSNIWQHLNIFKESLRIPHDLRGRKELEEIQRFQNVWPITFFSLFQSIDPRSGGGEVERPITLPPLFTCRPRKLAYGEKENNDQWIYFTYLTTSIWHCDYVVPWNAMFIKEQTNPFFSFSFGGGLMAYLYCMCNISP